MGGFKHSESMFNDPANELLRNTFTRLILAKIPCDKNGTISYRTTKDKYTEELQKSELGGVCSQAHGIEEEGAGPGKV